MEYGRTRGLPYTILRPTTVYGPRAVYGGGQIFFSLSKMKVVAMPTSLTGRVPLVHVRDVCGAALYLAEQPAASGQVYNVNDDSQMSTVEFSQYLAGVMGKRFVGLPPVPVPLPRLLNGGNQVEVYQLARLGDRIRAKSTYVDIYQKEGRSGTLVFILLETVYANQNGEMLLK